MSSGEISGGCACGAIRYAAAGPVKFALRCACRDCQHDSGAGHGIHVGVPRDGFAVTGSPTIYTRMGDSGAAVHKAFCPTCGCPLYGLADRAPSTVLLVAGSLDDPARITPRKVIWRQSAQPWDLLPEDIP
ncbi:MAG: GFA family protein [Rhodobacteraceae bacterium]|nr:GFA family protein [Paracoccaceae bacterium]